MWPNSKHVVPKVVILDRPVPYAATSKLVKVTAFIHENISRAKEIPL
jgi:hypothetical protein